MSIKNIPLYDKIGYGSGNLGFGIIFQIVVAYLVFYSTAILNVPGSLVGLAVSISVIWDGFTDPFMGYISDRTGFKTYGRRHLYILIGTFGMALSNYFLWNANQDFTVFNKFIWIFTGIMVLKTFMTVYNTPYTALGAELSKDYDERSSIQGIRTIFFLLGLGLGSAGTLAVFFGATEEFVQGQLNPLAYNNMGLATSILMLVTGLYCFGVTKKYVSSLPGPNIDAKGEKKRVLFNVYSNFTAALKNKYYKFVVLGYLFTNISSCLVGTLGLHVFTYTFGLDGTDIAVIIGMQFFASIVSQPIWVMISRRIDKKPAVAIGLLISITGCLVFTLLVLIKDLIFGNFIYILPFAVLTGFGVGGLFSLPLSMVADTIDLEEYNTGKRSEGIYYGLMTFAYKLSQSIAVFLLGILLDIVGFDAGLQVQAESTVITLGLILSVGSLLSFVAALVTYGKYNLNKGKILDFQKKIADRQSYGI